MTPADATPVPAATARPLENAAGVGFARLLWDGVGRVPAAPRLRRRVGAFAPTCAYS